MDILRFNNVNADAWTATVSLNNAGEGNTDVQYHTGYYSAYAAEWPDFCVTAESTGGEITAYSEFIPESSSGRP